MILGTMKVFPKLTDFEFMRIVYFMNERYGINLEKKREHIESRLACDLDKLGAASYAELIAAVESEPDGMTAQEMVDRLTTNHTYFFRDTESFEHLKKRFVSQLDKSSSEPIRLWSAGCATGQECYTALMVLDKALEEQKIERDYELMASDICIKSLNTAKAAVYPISALKEIPDEYLGYCRIQEDGKTFTIANKLRSRVRFARLNLMDELNMENRFDAVFCRNVMIYFKPETRERILNKLYLAVKGAGYLYTGTVELILNGNPFEFTAPSVYVKNRKAEGARE